MSAFCSSCQYRGRCSSECAELTLYLKELDKEQAEITVGIPEVGGKIEWSSSYPLTTREKEIVTLLGKGLNRKEVCELVNITRGNLRLILKRIKEKYLN